MFLFVSRERERKFYEKGGRRNRELTNFNQRDSLSFSHYASLFLSNCKVCEIQLDSYKYPRGRELVRVFSRNGRKWLDQRPIDITVSIN